MKVTRIDGSRCQAQLVSWDTTTIAMLTEGEQLSIASADLLRVQFIRETPSTSAPPAFVQLTDGTRLPINGFTVRDRQATISTPVLPAPLTMSTDKVAWVQLLPGATEELSQDLLGDRLVISKKKTDSFDSLDGLLGDVTATEVRFTWDGDIIPVKRSKVAALAYFHAKPISVPSPACWLQLTGGARLPAAEISAAGEQLSVTTTDGILLSVPLAELRYADYSSGKLVYLSDLTPVSQSWTPRINLPAAAELIQAHGLPRRDQSFTGSPLSLLWPHPKTGIIGGDVRTYEKGLALRSRTICRYRIPKEMSRFVTTVGIDPHTSEQGHVTLEVFADKRSVWQGEIAGGVDPTEINVELGRARALRIVVDFGENLDFGDRLHLAEARLTK
ncbi:MAG: NPCBM/NEW2 domain-containing protein [Planctomycetota bacterium]